MSKDYLTENAGEFPVYSSQTANNGVFGRIIMILNQLRGLLMVRMPVRSFIIIMRSSVSLTCVDYFRLRTKI